MAGTQPRTVLKQRPWRTTEVEAGPEPAFVKRFHDGRTVPPLARWLDRRRARSEARRLAELSRAGLPVPRVLGIAETAAGVELRLEYLVGARPLADLLAGAPDELAAVLGTLLARLHAAGYAHGDLHAGNVVVDGRGQAWLVDAAAIRRGSAAARARDLVHAAAAARETTSPRFRARFLLAYLRRAPSTRRSETASLVEAIEGAARIARRERVRAESDRWLRESGLCARHAAADLTVLAPRRIPAEEALALGRRALADPRDASILVVGGSRARAAWLDCGRLAEHGLDAVRPLVLVEAPRTAAICTIPAGSRPPRRGDEGDCRAVGALAGALWDRGLALTHPAVLIDGDSRAFVAGDAGLAPAGAFARWIRTWGGTPTGDSPEPAPCWSASAGFVTAFLAAQRGTRTRRDLVRQRLATAEGVHAPGDGRQA